MEGSRMGSMAKISIALIYLISKIQLAGHLRSSTT